MTSKGKKAKKKTPKVKQENRTVASALCKPDARTIIKNKVGIYTYFSSDEISTIKTILKVKDVSGVPYIIGAIVLNKFDLLRHLINEGCNINESGPSNSSALIWATKYKNMEMIEYLISKGADPTMKTEKGDNVLIIALEHKSWEEQAYLNLWKMVKTISFIDVNYASKPGRNMLHIAVRRDWEELIKILITENANVNLSNSNGVTPLMLACYKNNVNVAMKLIAAGANILKEDHHNRMAVCYAISSELKNSKPPFVLSAKVLTELKKFISVEEYAKKILEIILSLPAKPEFPRSTSEMMVYIVHYMIQYISDGPKIIMKLKFLEQIAETTKVQQNPEIIKFFVKLILEVFFYNEQTSGFAPQIQKELTICFIDSDLPNICMGILINDEDNCSYLLCFYTMVLFGTITELGQSWMQQNYHTVLPIYQQYVNNLADIQEKMVMEEKRLKIIKKHLKKLRRFLSQFNRETPENLSVIKDNSKEENIAAKEELKGDGSVSLSSKQRKRRLKALKAKKAKLVSIQLTETRLTTLTGKLVSECDLQEEILSPANCEDDVVDDLDEGYAVEEHNQWAPIFGPYKFTTQNILVKQHQNPIAHGILQFLKRVSEPPRSVPEKSLKSLWITQIKFLPFKRGPFFEVLLSINRLDLVEASECLKSMAENNISPQIDDIRTEVDLIIQYLTDLLQILIIKYKHHWENDMRINLHPDTYKVNMQEMEKLDEIQLKFEELIRSIREMAGTNMIGCYRTMCALESILLNYKIRGRTFMYELCPSERFRMQNKHQHESSLQPSDQSILQFIEDKVNDRKDRIRNCTYDFHPNFKRVNPENLSASGNNKRTSTIVDAATEPKYDNPIEIKERTLNNAYHMFNEMATICDDNNDDDDDYNKFKNSNNMTTISKYPSLNYFNGPDQVASRWSGRIRSLMWEKHVQKLLSGDVIISLTPTKYQEYVISHGGNFNPVILGLSANRQQALAVKMLSRKHSVSKLLKSLINPLLGLRHKYLLHYYACDYEYNELILATPLCEFNIGQYVTLLKKGGTQHNVFNLTPLDIVRQFLLGLRYLHIRNEPIVHGNLKPSNIFVQINGVVKVAEFGTHKALYKTVEAPKSSLIWFAQETYNGYKRTATIECTCSSDIQVAGMLIYYILSGGDHPCGSHVNIILKNLENSILFLPKTIEATLNDLVTGMMMHNPMKRPNIEQVLAHIMFWSEERKWRFILNCAGINYYHRNRSTVTPLDIDVKNLLSTIDKRAIQEQYNGKWVDIMKTVFPNVCVCAEDTLAGLLRFIRYLYDKHSHIMEIKEAELRKQILPCFSRILLSLCKILGTTNWLNHPVFYEYTEAESNELN